MVDRDVCDCSPAPPPVHIQEFHTCNRKDAAHFSEVAGRPPAPGKCSVADCAMWLAAPSPSWMRELTVRQRDLSCSRLQTPIMRAGCVRNLACAWRSKGFPLLLPTTHLCCG